MRVYINMEMPQSCDDCRLNNGISCYAVPEYTEDGVVGRTDDRPDWCPLVQAADVLPRDEAITMGAELAAMHGSDATSQQLEEAYLKGVEDGMTRRDVRPVVRCKDCRHRDPEDHKCDSGETERQGCPFKVADDYFCAYGER